jgi:hypothetical protein
LLLIETKPIERFESQFWFKFFPLRSYRVFVYDVDNPAFLKSKFVEFGVDKYQYVIFS